MRLSNLLSTVPVFAGLCSAVPHEKRTIDTAVTLYAYGTNISGLSIYYGVDDGKSTFPEIIYVSIPLINAHQDLRISPTSHQPHTLT